MSNDNHTAAQALRQIAEIIERGEWGREAKRLVDRKILGGLDDRGCRVPGALLARYNELTRQGGDGMNMELHAIRSALVRLGDLMRKGAPAVAERAGVAETLRKAAELFTETNADPPAVPRQTTNDRMLAQFTRDRRCIGWSAAVWSALLGVAKSTVTSTPTWKLIQAERERERREKRERGGQI